VTTRMSQISLCICHMGESVCLSVSMSVSMSASMPVFASVSVAVAVGVATCECVCVCVWEGGGYFRFVIECAIVSTRAHVNES